MSEVYITGTRENIAGLLRLMADEVEQEGFSATAFSEEPDWDPFVSIRCRANDDRYNTCVKVRP